MKLSEYERQTLLEFAAAACNEFAMCVAARSEDTAAAHRRVVLLNEQASQLVEVFNNDPCHALSTQIRRCINLYGQMPRCAIGKDKDERDKAVERWSDFKNHMNCRIKEYQRQSRNQFRVLEKELI